MPTYTKNLKLRKPASGEKDYNLLPGFADDMDKIDETVGALMLTVGETNASVGNLDNRIGLVEGRLDNIDGEEAALASILSRLDLIEAEVFPEDEEGE